MQIYNICIVDWRNEKFWNVVTEKKLYSNEMCVDQSIEDIASILLPVRYFISQFYSSFLYVYVYDSNMFDTILQLNLDEKY